MKEANKGWHAVPQEMAYRIVPNLPRIVSSGGQLKLNCDIP